MSNRSEKINTYMVGVYVQKKHALNFLSNEERKKRVKKIKRSIENMM